MVILFCPTHCRIISRARWEIGRRRILRSFKKPRKMFVPGSRNCSRSTELVHSIPSIASLAFFSGTNAECRATKRDCARRSKKFPKLREEFWHDVRVPGGRRGFQSVVGTRRTCCRFPGIRRADVYRRTGARRILLARIFAKNTRPPDGEALRDDENHAAVFAWEFQGDGKTAEIASRTAAISKPCI